MDVGYGSWSCKNERFHAAKVKGAILDYDR